jgi:hypothetical protein
VVEVKGGMDGVTCLLIKRFCMGGDNGGKE